MKRTLSSLLAAMLISICTTTAFAQNAGQVEEVATIDRHQSRAFRQGEVIVKFKTNSRVKINSRRGARGVETSAGNLNSVLQKIGAAEIEQLMPLTGPGGKKRARGHNGTTVESDDMSQLYRLRFDEKEENTVYRAVDELQKLDEVEYAEPNYIVYATVLPDGTSSCTYEDEPLFKEQWAFNAINLKNVWTKKIITNKRPVIAILDTGVDTEHPDLAANIWTNAAEASGAEDEDDDNNGYADDLHGWDFVNQTARLGDWNGHGTHCAGIAAAVGKNGIGITGANPDAFIMPVTIMQSDGTGDVATIIKGIDYAAANGADVINMSFGGYGYSIAEEQALARAYQTAVLVAAAGNDCLPINSIKCDACKKPGAPMFPAAFTFVLGVESSNRDGNRASFSNYDDDGPTFSEFGEEKLYNYELRAPGVAIMSTYPGGKYKALNGTSMAAPLVAGAISRLLQCKEYPNKELLFGDLIYARSKNSNGIVDFQAAYEITDKDRVPELQLVTYMLNDDLETGYYIDSTSTAEGFKVTTDKEEHWYCIKFNAEDKKFTSSVSGAKIGAGTANCGDDDLWKITGTPEAGYSLTNRHGYTLFVNTANIDEAAYASLSPKNISKFDIVESASYKGCYEIRPAGNTDCALKVYYTDVTLGWANDYYTAIKFQPVKIIEEFVSSDNIDLQGDGDGKADAGEIIGLYPTLRTTWGTADNIKFSLEVGEAEDPEIVEIIDREVVFGKKLDSYAKARSVAPLRFKINDKCVDGRHIRLRLRATCDNAKEELVHDFVITAENGVEIGGMIAEDMTLYPNVHYIVTSSLAVPEGVTLTIKPGTVLKFKDYTGLVCRGKLDCIGKPDSLITFTKADLNSGYIKYFDTKDTIGYSVFKNLYFSAFENDYMCEGFSIEYAENCIFDNITAAEIFYSTTIKVSKCNILNSTLQRALHKYSTTFLNCNIQNNKVSTYIHSYGSSSAIAISNLKNCNSYTNYYPKSWRDDYMLFSVDYENSDIAVYNSEDQNYLGTAQNKKLEQLIIDFDNPYYSTGFGNVDLNFISKSPSNGAHGIVWKVVVNGYDAQDEFELLSPLGVGKHKFEVYFNRPMDVSVAPTVAMGVRPPYTQKPIAEEGSWSADSLIYTAYLTIDGKSGCDGLNRIYVAGARDNEYFDIPVENMRFNVEVAAAGSMSTGLMAEAGLGKVTLTWNTDEEDFEDLLGYNIIRYTDLEGDTIIANENIIESSDTMFVDYNVEPEITYYYTIKQLTTSFASHAMSNVVAATPLTAQKGDANGSMAVDVADVVTEVAWLTNQDPQPFIFEAADVNSDNNVNVLDIVGTVSIIVAPQENTETAISSTATYTVEDGILYVESPVALGGVQVKIAANKGTQFVALDALTGFEQVGDWQSDEEYLFLAFSMSGKALPAGKHALLNVGSAMVREVVFSNTRGGNVVAIDGNTTGIGAVEGMQMQLPHPNPFTTELCVPYTIGKEGEHNVKIVVSDIAGRTLHSYAIVNSRGEYSYTWRPDANVAGGFYFVSLYVNDALMQTAKVIYKK